MQCKICGSEIYDGAYICPVCGNQQGTVEQLHHDIYNPFASEYTKRAEKKKGKPAARIIAVVCTAVVILGGGTFAAFKVLPKLRKAKEQPTVETLADIGYTSPPNTEAFVPLDNGTYLISDELIVCFDPLASENDINALIESYDGEIVGRNQILGDYQIRFTGSGKDYIENIADSLGQKALVETVCWNYAFENDETFYPDDPEYTNKWDISDPGGNNWGLELIDAPGAWEYRDKLRKVKVGVLDSVLDHDHDDLQIPPEHTFVLPTDEFRTLSHLEEFYDLNSSHQCSGSKRDNCVFCNFKNHGTHVSGIIAAKLNNGTGAAGVAPNADLYFGTYWYYYSGNSEYPLGSLKDDLVPGGAYSSFYSMMYGISRLASNGCRVINMSVGSSEKSEPGEEEAVLADYADRAFRLLEDQGYDFLVIKSAGNGNSLGVGQDASNYFDNRILTTGSCARAHTIIVANCTDNIFDTDILRDSLAAWIVNTWGSGNAYALNESSNYGDLVDVAAPGTDILNAYYGNEYDNMSGTSMAAPMTAGVCALVYGADPSLKYSVVKTIVCNTGKAQAIRGPSYFYTIVNAKEALSCALSLNGGQVPTLPAPYKPDADPNAPNLCYMTGSIYDGDTGMLLESVVEVCAVNDKTGEKFYSTNEAKACTSGSDGITVTTSYVYNFTLPPGNYTIELTADGFEDIQVTGIKVTAGVLEKDFVMYRSESDGKAVYGIVGAEWVVNPTIDADDIIVGDRYSGFDTSLSSPYVYIERNGKYGLIGYDGEIAVDPEYDSFNGDDFYGLDDFVAVYDSKSGDTIFVQNYNTSGNENWEMVEQKKAFGQPGIGTNATTYFIDENDGKLYEMNSFSNKPEETFSADASYVVQKINCVRSKYGIEESSATDEKFYLYSGGGLGEESFVTEGYKYVYSNGQGSCGWSGYPDNRFITDGYTTVAFSNDMKKWDVYDSLGYLIASDLETFDCNLDLTPWWSPVTAFFNNADSYDSAENIYGKPAPFCATEGYIAAKKDGEYGYLDLDGNEVIPFGILEDVRPVHDGKAWAKFEGKWGVLSFE